MTTGVSRSASSTSRSAARNGLSNGFSVSSPSRLITATPPCTTRPRPGVRGDRFAGRSTRSVPLRYGAKPCWPQTQLPSVITSAPEASSRSAIFAVIPRPSAAFSPFTMQKSTPSSSRSAGSCDSTARRPGAPNTSPTKRILTGLAGRPAHDGERRGRMHLDQDVIARVVRVARERLRLDLRQVEQLPSFVLPAVTDAPTVSDGSTAMFETETIERRRGGRLDVDLLSVYLAVQDDLLDPDHRAVDGRVDVGSGAAPTSSAEVAVRRRRKQVPVRPARAAAEDGARHA